MTSDSVPVRGGVTDTLPLSVVILTFNEERNLSSCLASLAGRVADIHVLDSGSTDATVEVAHAAGVPVHHNPFRGFGQQRNWAIDNVPHEHSWVLHLDADERMTAELHDELRGVLSRQPLEAGFYLASKLMLGGHWLRHSSGYPVYQVRLFHKDRLRFADHGHGQREVTDGVVGYLKHPYLHDAFSKGLEDWFAKHARYARAEAMLLHRERRSVAASLLDLVTADRVGRRRALKSLAYRMPARSMLRFLQIIVLNRGFLDGPAGLVYARMLVAYESMLDVHFARLRSGIDF